jgi:intracellular sulfur oxidation DsrE/DsrF family protein
MKKCFHNFSDVCKAAFLCIESLTSQTYNKDTLMKQVTVLNELWSESVKLSILVMIHVKFGEREDAESVLRNAAEHFAMQGWNSEQQVTITA